jgi:hypothetical protein
MKKILSGMDRDVVPQALAAASTTPHGSASNFLSRLVMILK